MIFIKKKQLKNIFIVKVRCYVRLYLTYELQMWNQTEKKRTEGFVKPYRTELKSRTDTPLMLNNYVIIDGLRE